MRRAVRHLLAVLALFLTVPGALPSNPAAAETIQLKKHAGGGYLIPGRINDAVTVTFVLDTGASDVSIPENVARELEPGLASAGRRSRAQGLRLGILQDRLPHDRAAMRRDRDDRQRQGLGRRDPPRPRRRPARRGRELR